MRHLFFLLVPLAFPEVGLAQTNGRPDVIQRANNTVNKVSNTIAIFQPYLLKARQVYYDTKQLANDVKNSSQAAFGKNRNGGTPDPNANGNPYPGQNNPYPGQNNPYPGQNTPYPGQGSGRYDSSNSYSGSSSGSNNYPNNTNAGNGYTGQNSDGYSNPAYQAPQSYLPNQSLPVNNPASINNDGTGNWGNQNNGLYGNCLDALTGTVLGMGEASQTPGSVDLLFFAPADGQNSFYLMTPGYARNNGSYMTEHVSDQLLSWSEVNETEVALTRVTIGQFEQIQNNSQIQNAVRNAQNYAGYYSSVGVKLDGQVFAVKTQMENREVYALIAIIRQIGTSGNNGYLKIKIKTQGIGANGQINANAYMR